MSTVLIEYLRKYFTNGETPNVVQTKNITINKYATSEIGCNSSDLMELRAKRRQQQIKLAHEQNLTQENIEDSEREQRANMLIKDLFGK
ncbi:13949_t:CDS:2 [Funneliformis geosporum]|uniref:13949_t:CDS:1 n=1 Tax=Funneliformis geosporum TaxID=1117311 RepID=A0A9W4SDJ1_9GLOM|nr:13949_t:CDS:2 [Funneliformis geosporum]